MPGLEAWVSESWGAWDNFIGTKRKSGWAAVTRWHELDTLLGSSRRPCGWVGLGKSGPALPPTAPLRCTLSSISGPLATRSPPSSEGEVTAEFTFPSAVAWIRWVHLEGRKEGRKEEHPVGASVILMFQWSRESMERACRLRQSPQLRAPWRVRVPGRRHWGRWAPQCNMENYDDVCTGIHMQQCVCVCQIHTYIPTSRGAGREEGGERQRNNTTALCHNAA